MKRLIPLDLPGPPGLRASLVAKLWLDREGACFYYHLYEGKIVTCSARKLIFPRSNAARAWKWGTGFSMPFGRRRREVVAHLRDAIIPLIKHFCSEALLNQAHVRSARKAGGYARAALVLDRTLDR